MGRVETGGDIYLNYQVIQGPHKHRDEVLHLYCDMLTTIPREVIGPPSSCLPSNHIRVVFELRYGFDNSNATSHAIELINGRVQPIRISVDRFNENY